MITETQRRVMHARQRVNSFLVEPITELLEATRVFVEEADQRANDAKEVMEELRPVWALGFTSDSEAAQSTGNALAEIWKTLGVKNQTECMVALHALIQFAEKSND